MRLAAVLLLLLGIAACDTAPAPGIPLAGERSGAAHDEPGLSSEARVAYPRAYAVKSDYDAPDDPARSDRRRLELFVPDGFGPHPVVVLIHGGGFTAGSRDEVAALGRTLQSMGYAAAAVGYRLSPSVPVPEDLGRVVHPDHTNDVADALRWLVDHAPEHRLDADALVLLGHSSGSTIATLLGLNPTYLDAAGVDRGRIAAVLRIDGHATDLADVVPRDLPYDSRSIVNIFGPDRSALYPEILDMDADGEPIYDAPSPLNLSPWYHVADGADLPPILVTSGTARDRERYSKAFHLRLRAFGFDAEYLHAELNHGRMLNALHRPNSRVEARYQADVLAFLHRVTADAALRP